MTLEERVTTTRVVLALEGFTGIFDNELTMEREFWLRGRCERSVKGPGMINWCVPNPDPMDEAHIYSVIAAANRRRELDNHHNG